MIRLFGKILGFVLVVNIVVSFYQSDYNLSSLSIISKEIVRVVKETIDDVDKKGMVILQNTNIAQQPEPVAAVMPTAQDVADGTVAVQDFPISPIEQIVEQPEELRIFWGPFRYRNTAEGFAVKAGNIGGLQTEVVAQQKNRFYVAFVGQPEAIENALATFSDQTGMVLQKQI